MNVTPNIVYIYADDLGHGMLSCYGQKQFVTPNIDRLAAEGVRCTRAYGTAFCAPARASLLTGMHDAHAGRWTFNRAGLINAHHIRGMALEELYEIVNNTGIRPQDGDTFLATVAQRAGYVTGQVGKLEWGFTTSPEELSAHGWDYHYGYYDHAQCHGFYPPYVFENGRKVEIRGNTRSDFGCGRYGDFPDGTVDHDAEGRAVHSQDLFDAKISEFLSEHRDEPFFLYHPSQLPHGPIYYPDIHPDLVGNSELTPVEKEFASMVLRLDETVGKILDQLEALGIREKTMVLFASDNGHTTYYEQPGRVSGTRDLEGNVIDNRKSRFTTETCGDPLNGNGGLGGLKTTNWEGGARIPFIVSWPGQVERGVVSDRLLANYDTLATVADLVEQSAPVMSDGVSFLPMLLGEEGAEHDVVVYSSQFGPSLVTADGWKLRTFLQLDTIIDFATFGADFDQLEKCVELQLYHLPTDPSEAVDVAEDHPDLMRHLITRLLRECDGNLANGTPEAHFAFYPPYGR